MGLRPAKSTFNFPGFPLKVHLRFLRLEEVGASLSPALLLAPRSACPEATSLPLASGEAQPLRKSPRKRKAGDGLKFRYRAEQQVGAGKFHFLSCFCFYLPEKLSRGLTVSK